MDLAVLVLLVVMVLFLMVGGSFGVPALCARLLRKTQIWWVPSALMAVATIALFTRHVEVHHHLMDGALDQVAGMLQRAYAFVLLVCTTVLFPLSLYWRRKPPIPPVVSWPQH
jgi:hypothetical protein